MVKNKDKGVFILSLQAKDIFIANNLVADREKIEQGKRISGYSTKNLKGREFNSNRYKTSFDYSLDFLKIRDLCQEKSIKEKSIKFSFTDASDKGDKLMSDIVININFNFTVKAFNKNGDLYSKFGQQYTYADFNKIDKTSENSKTYSIFNTGAIVENGELLGIMLNQKVDKPINSELLGKYFCYDDDRKCYKKTKVKIPTMNIDDGDAKLRLDCKTLRRCLYENGFYVNGKKYVRYKRSAGSSRDGKCLFVDSRLIKDLKKYDSCGLKISEGDDIDLAAYESYIALTSSSIIDTIKIKKENILLIKDYKSKFTDNAVAVWSNEHNELEAAEQEVEISNNIWDGQSIIDTSLMGDYQDKGMLLLRNRFFKSCCFNGNVQKFFKDHGVTSVEQLNGFTLATDIEDIKLITTESSLKYLKFGTVEQWFDNYIEDFGIVKYEKTTPYFDGNLMQMSYQMINGLQFSKEQIEEFLEPSINFMRQLRDSHLAVKYFINYRDELDELDGLINEQDKDYNESFDAISSKNDLIFKLLNVNCDFHKSKMYSDFKKDLIDSFVKKIKQGKVLVKGTYATVCSNPVEMLYFSVLDSAGKNMFESTGFKSVIGIGNIYNTKYSFNKVLFGARKPFITMGNCWLPVNRDNPLIQKYMNPTSEIVYINSIDENVLNRNNGMDMDSDTVALVDEPIIIELVQKNYDNFLVPTSLIEGKKTQRKHTTYELADLDNKTSVNKIGEIVNMSQKLNSELWHNLNNGGDLSSSDTYLDICKLAVLSGCEIDSAKKEFAINTPNEIKIIRNKLNKIYEPQLSDFNANNEKQKKSLKPNFMGVIDKSKGYDTKDNDTLYINYDTAMDYLQEYIKKASHGFTSKGGGGNQKLLRMKDLIIDEKYNNSKEDRHRIESIICKVKETSGSIGKLWGKKRLSLSSKRDLARWHRNELLKELEKSVLSESTVIGLLRRSDTIGDKSGLLLQALLDVKGINIMQYFISKDDKAASTEQAEKISELFEIFKLTT